MDDIESDFHLVEPGCVCGLEMNVVSGSFGQPSFDLGVFAYAIVVDDQVNLKIFRHILVNLIEKLQELLVAVSALALRLHVAGGDI